MKHRKKEVLEALQVCLNILHGWMDECKSWWNTSYIGDWTFLTKILVKGPDALKFLSNISVNSFAKYDVGQSKHVLQCNKEGAVINDGILMKLNEEEYVYQAGPIAFRQT